MTTALDNCAGSPALLHGPFGGHSAPAINTARAPSTARVRDYDGVNWNGALQGEVDGLPVGMTVPQALPFDFGGAGGTCDFGGCGSGFQGPGVLVAGGAACGLSGVCDVAAVAAAAAEAGVAIYEMSKGGKRRVADTGVEGEMRQLMGQFPNMNHCDALDLMMSAAKQEGDKAQQLKIKATQKQYKCRGHS